MTDGLTRLTYGAQRLAQRQSNKVRELGLFALFMAFMIALGALRHGVMS